jgi:hypothetical protein
MGGGWRGGENGQRAKGKAWHRDIGGSLELDSNSSFQATLCDFGSSTTSTENTGTDLLLDSAYLPYEYDEDATFTCTDTYCGTKTTSAFGGTTTTASASSGARGNIVLATKSATIGGFTMYLDPPSASCSLTSYVLSASSLSGTWRVDDAYADTFGSTAGKYYTGFAGGVAVEVGRYYAFVMGWSCTSGVTYASNSAGASSLDAGFGTTAGYWSDSTFTGYSGTTASFASSSSTRYGMSVTWSH